MGSFLHKFLHTTRALALPFLDLDFGSPYVDYLRRARP